MIFKMQVANGRDLDLYLRIDQGAGHSLFMGVYNDKEQAMNCNGALAMVDLATPLIEQCIANAEPEDNPMLRDASGEVILPDYLLIPEKDLNNWVGKSIYLAYANPVHALWTLIGFKHGRQPSHADFQGGDLALLEDINTHMRTTAPVSALRYAYDPAIKVEIEKVGS